MTVIFLTYWSGLFLKTSNIFLSCYQFKPKITRVLIIYLIGYIIIFISSFFPIAILSLGMRFELSPIADNPYAATMGTGFFVLTVSATGKPVRLKIMEKQVEKSQIVKSLVLLIIPLIIIPIFFIMAPDSTISISYYLIIITIVILIIGRIIDSKSLKPEISEELSHNGAQ
ncbi:MAG: hypothetical protein ACP6IY_17520 [Promethearchaeia archaeon]